MVWGQPWYSHIIYIYTYKGTTERSLPSEWPDDMLCDCTDNRWQSVESMIKWVTWMDAKLQLGPDPSDWLLLIDVAPVHVAYDFRKQLPKHIHLCYVNPRTTSVAQPADVGVTKPFKDALSVACGKFWAKVLMDTLEAGGDFLLTDRLSQNRQHMPTCVHQAVESLKARQKVHRNAWRHITDYDLQAVLEEARKHQAEGTLFRGGKRGALPEGDLQTAAPADIASAVVELAEKPRPQLTRAERLLALRLTYGGASQQDFQNAGTLPG